MSQFQLFRDRNQAGTKVQKAQTINFIENHVSSTEVTNYKTRESMKAVLTRTHKEGISETLLFTYVDSPEKNLNVGDYIIHGKKFYLTMLDYDHPLKKDYLKYNLIECNSVLRFDGIELNAAYFGSGRAYSNNKTDDQADFSFIQENNTPVIITQANRHLKIGTRFILAAEAYKIIAIDKNSVKGIFALSVEQSNLNPTTDDLDIGSANTVPEPSTIINENKYQQGKIVTLDIIGGYVRFTPMVNIISRDLQTVTFEVPYDIDILKIETKDSDGNVQIETKEVE